MPSNSSSDVEFGAQNSKSRFISDTKKETIGHLARWENWPIVHHLHIWLKWKTTSCTIRCLAPSLAINSLNELENSYDFYAIFLFVWLFICFYNMFLLSSSKCGDTFADFVLNIFFLLSWCACFVRFVLPIIIFYQHFLFIRMESSSTEKRAKFYSRKIVKIE